MESFYEVQVSCYFKQDISFKYIGERLGVFLNHTMEKDSFLSKVHKSDGIKLYGYNYPAPFEKDKIYKAGKVYTFKLRTPIDEIAFGFMNQMQQSENADFKFLGSQIHKRMPKIIEAIQTTTPAVITLGQKYWTKEDGSDMLFDKIHNNLVKKYNIYSHQNEQFDTNSIEFLQVMNSYPIIVNYKKGTIFGHKFNMRFKMDEGSQKLARTAAACSILEKNSSIGGGFCLYKTL